jgi:hypothetical protein
VNGVAVGTTLARHAAQAPVARVDAPAAESLESQA